MNADEHEVDLLIKHLAEKHRGTFDHDEVAQLVQRARVELEEESSQGEFLPIFIQRRTESLLRERAAERGLDLDRVQQILFLDDRNTGRSQIAAAVANGKGDGLIRARSGGVAPGEQIQDRVAELLRERGYDPEEDEVSAMTGKAALTSDVVVTMGLTDEQKQDMPTHGLHQIDWDDLGPMPADAAADELRGVFDEIERRVEDLVQDLLHDDTLSRRTEPEVEQEIDQAIADLHRGD